MNNHMQYVNSTMNEINNLCSELYEALADKDVEEIKDIIRKLNKVLRDVHKSNHEDI
jgi:mevalonate kinase